MTNIQGPGKAVYLEGLKFQFSEPDDWGWFYQLDEDGKIVSLLIRAYKKFFGWTVEILEFDDKNEEIIIDKGSIDERNGFLHSFSVHLKNKPTIDFTQQHRVSLKRYERWKRGIDKDKTPYLVPESGYYPSLFFFMLGAPGNGKTCWLNALKYPDIKDRATSQHDNLFYPGEESDELVKPASTNINEIILKTFYLRGNKDKKIKALVFVVDLGGEINRAANVINNQAEKEAKAAILKTIRDNAAAIFVVRSERWLLRLRTEQSKNECGADPNENIFNILQDEKKIEFCYILTGVDRIKKIIEEKPEQAGKCVLTPDSPIFHNTNKSESQMYENMAIASHIMKKRDTDRNIGDDDPCFAVSCGSDLLVQEEKKELDPLPHLPLGKGQEPIDYDEFYKKFVDNVGEGNFDYNDKLIKKFYRFYNDNKIYINPDQVLSLYKFYKYVAEKDKDVKPILSLDFYNFYSRSKEGASQENLDTEEEDKRISNILESYKLSKISEVLKLKPEDAYNVELPLVYMLKKLIKIEDD